MSEHIACELCDGSGVVDGAECPDCCGYGELESLAESLDENWVHDSDMEDR